MSGQYVTIKALAVELGLDRSALRKYIIAQGFTFMQVRTEDSRRQLTLALSAEDAQLVRERRRAQGFERGASVIQNGDGYFYVVQLVPELDPGRVKLGFATNMGNRLDAHRTSSPTAKLLKHWPCKKTWEIAAMASITRAGCKPIGSEVYQCDNVQKLMAAGDAFFGIMP